MARRTPGAYDPHNVRYGKKKKNKSWANDVKDAVSGYLNAGGGGNREPTKAEYESYVEQQRRKRARRRG